MQIRKAILLSIGLYYFIACLTPFGAAAQNAGAFVGGLAGGIVGGMIAGSMARQNAGNYYYRQPRVSRSYQRSHVRSAARQNAPGHAPGAAAINASSDPFAKTQSPPTTSVGTR